MAPLTRDPDDYIQCKVCEKWSHRACIDSARLNLAEQRGWVCGRSRRCFRSVARRRPAPQPPITGTPACTPQLPAIAESPVDIGKRKLASATIEEVASTTDEEEAAVPVRLVKKRRRKQQHPRRTLTMCTENVCDSRANSDCANARCKTHCLDHQRKSKRDKACTAPRHRLV